MGLVVADNRRGCAGRSAKVAVLLHDRYNLSVCSSSSNTVGLTVAGDDMINAGLYNARIEILECPSSPTAGERRNNLPGGNDNYSMRDAWRTNYTFSTGVFTDQSNTYTSYSGDSRQGAFGNNGGAKFAAITDGTSMTIALGEAVGGALWKTSVSYGPWGLTGAHTCCHGRVSSNTSALPPVFTAAQKQDTHINSPYQGNVDGKTYAWTFGSKHPGGAQFVLCDGAVRWPKSADTFRGVSRVSSSRNLCTIPGVILLRPSGAGSRPVLRVWVALHECFPWEPPAAL